MSTFPRHKHEAPARVAAFALLLESVAPRGLPLARTQELLAAPIDWDWAFEQARAHKLLALFSARLAEQRDSLGLTADVEQRLDSALADCESKAKKAERTLRFLDEHAASVDLPFFVVKGSTLAQHTYGDVRHRSFNDVDVVIHQDRINDIEPLLLENQFYFFVSPGYAALAPKRVRRRLLKGVEPGSAAAARLLLEHYHRHFTYVLKPDDPRLPLELHWHLFPPGWGRATAADLWEETEEIELCGVKVLALNPEAALLHTAVHAMEQQPEGFKLLHLCDVVWCFERATRLNAAKLAALADKWDLAPFVTRALAAAESVFPFTLERARQFWPRRNPLRDKFLVHSGMNPRFLAKGQLAPSERGLFPLLSSEVLWDLSYNRPPQAAWRRVDITARARATKLAKAFSRNERETTPDGD